MASVLLEKRAAPVYAPFIVIPPLTSCEPSFLVFVSIVRSSLSRLRVLYLDLSAGTTPTSVTTR